MNMNNILLQTKFDVFHSLESPGEHQEAVTINLALTSNNDNSDPVE